jgi:hypothetical protein
MSNYDYYATLFPKENGKGIASGNIRVNNVWYWVELFPPNEKTPSSAWGTIRLRQCPEDKQAEYTAKENNYKNKYAPIDQQLARYKPSPRLNQEDLPF